MSLHKQPMKQSMQPSDVDKSYTEGATTGEKQSYTEGGTCWKYKGCIYE